MAFLSDDTVLTEMQDKMKALSEVAMHRESIFAENEDKPLKILIAFGIGAWVIYYFLIKR